jgi:hypothetical protein
VARLVTHLLESGYYEVKIHSDEIEVLPHENQQLPADVVKSTLLLGLAYPLLVRSVKEILRLRESLESTLAALPDPVVACLPTKNGSPWRSHYLRECLDVLHKWPAVVETSVPFLSPLINAPELVSAVLPKRHRDGFPLVQRFENFRCILNQAVFEIRSLRLDLNSSLSSNAEHDEDPSTINCGDVSAKRKGAKRCQPTKKTMEVIELIQERLSNDEIHVRLKASHREWNHDISYIRKIRSRLESGFYIIKPANRDTV